MIKSLIQQYPLGVLLMPNKITIPLAVSVDTEDVKRILSVISGQSEAVKLFEENRDTVEPILRAMFGAKS